MCYQSSFERKEIKYLLPPEVYQTVRAAAQRNMEPDKFPTAAVTSLYYDTPSRLLIRRSLEQPDYKEKLRVRVYGKADEASAACEKILREHADQLRAVAEYLLEHETMEAEEFN